MRGNPLDGHISRCLEGKTIEAVYKNGHVMTLRFTNGEEYKVAWANPDTGEAIPGEPCLLLVDVSVSLEGAEAEWVAARL